MCKHFFLVVWIIFPQSKWVHIYIILSLLPYTPPPPSLFLLHYIMSSMCLFLLLAYMMG